MSGLRTPARRARIRKALYERQHGRCWWCNCHMDLTGDPASPTLATFEHLIPKARGGVDAIRNLALACRACNNRRGAPEAITQEILDQGATTMAVAFARAGLVPA